MFLKAEEKERLDKYLANNTEYSRSYIKKLLDNDLIKVNGNKVKQSYILNLDDEIEINDTLKVETKLEKEDIPLDIVYEDEGIILINKPSGLVVHPGSGNHNHTLVNGLLNYTDNLSKDNDDDIRPGIVHRIDKDTSGLMLVAKTKEAESVLERDFASHSIKRIYYALLKGNLEHDKIEIDAPIGRDAKDRKKMAVTSNNSKRAVTHMKVLKQYKDMCLVRCELETGRTHQIRVHAKYIGHPIFNDPVYSEEIIKGYGQFLISKEITFTNPLTKEIQHFEIPLDKVFQNKIDELEKEITY